MSKIQKETDNSKYQRINTIYNLLANNASGMTISELARELDVSTKTIQRDLYEVLSEFGAAKEGRYWKINPKHAEDNLDQNERIVLGILDEMAKNAGKVFHAKAHTLLSQVTQQLEHPIFSGIKSEALSETDMELFELLEEAIKSKREVTFTYENYDFQVKPLKLVFFDGFWYLLSFDSKDKEIFKKFHLRSIKALKITAKSFDISQEIESKLHKANSVWFQLEDPFSVRLLIEKEVKKYFERKPLPSQSILGEDSDGSVEIEVEITHEMEILPLIMYYMPHIKVLEPDWLADKVKEKVENYLKEISS